MALTQVSTDGIKNGTITGSDLATNVDLVDNQKLRLGNSQDLQIFHNGTDSRIVNTTGDLSVRGGVIKLASTTGEEYIRCTANSSVDLFHDNVVKLTTNSDGYRSNDNVKAQFGDGNDLQIYHSGTESWIKETGVGNLYIASNKIVFQNAATNEDTAIFNENGAVELFYDDSKKFETLNDGVLVTGKVSATGDLAITSSDGQKIRIGQSNDLQIYHNGSHSYIEESGTGKLRILTSELLIGNPADNENIAKFIENGAVELYYDNSKKLETTANGATIDGGSNISMDSSSNGQLKVNGSGYSGAIALDGSAMNIYHNSSIRGIVFGINETEKVNIDTSGHLNIPNDSGRLRLGTGADLQIYHNGNDSYIDENGTGDLKIRSASGIQLQNGSEKYLACIPNGAVELYYDNSKKFETTSTGATLTGVLISDGLTLLDNEKILFGNNNDLEIFHNGTNNIIQSDVGDLQINSGNSAGDVVINTNNNVNNDTRVTSAKFIKNGSVELYHNGNRQVFTIDGGMNWQDNKNAEFGNSGDLKIFHNGTHNYISSSNGNIELRSTVSSDEAMIKCKPNDTVEIYYNGGKKLETLSDGIKVTGAIEAAGVPLQQVFNNTNTSLTKTGTGTVALGFSSMSMTTKRSNSLLVFSYTISGEIDGNRGQCFYRLFYSTSSDYSGEQAVNSTCFQGNSHNVSDGDFSDSGTFHFTNPVSAGTTIYLRMKYSNSNSGASIEFNQQSLTGQPSGTSNISFFRVEELTT